MDSNDAALIFVNTTTDISSSAFSQLQGLTFSPYANTGGVLICSNSIITISHSVLDSNEGEMGGAIFAESGCLLSATNSTFTNNHAEQGGVMMVSADFSSSGESDDYRINFSDCNFSGNSAHDGGVLYMELQTLDIQRCNFSHNEGINGGIMYVNESEVNVYDSWLVYNTAQQGGVLYAHDSDLNISDSNFTNNIASNGGVLYTANLANVDVYGSYFADNAVEYDGGVIFAISNVSIAIYNSFLNIMWLSMMVEYSMDVTI